jgi:hypothetical protein
LEPTGPIAKNAHKKPPAGNGTETHSRLAHWQTLISIVSEVVKTLAVVAGGAWVLFRFGVSEYPSLAPAMSARLGIEVAASETNGVCKVVLSVSFKNGSKSTVALSKVSLKVWVVKPTIDSTKVSFIDWQQARQGNPTWALPDNMNIFAKTYEPGQGASYGYTLFVPKAASDYLYGRIEVESLTTGIADEVWADSSAPLAC